MFHKYENIAISILFTIIIIISFFYFKKYIDKFRYTYTEEGDIIYKNKEKYRLFFLILGIYVPITEIPIYYFKVRDESMLTANVLIGLFCILIYWGSRKIRHIERKLPEYFVIFYFLFTVSTLIALYKSPNSVIAIGEFLMLLIFSSFTFYKREHTLMFTLFVLICLFIIEYVGAIDVKLLTTYSYITLLVFLINYGRSSIDFNIYLNLYASYYALRKGNLFSIGINENEQIQFTSQNVADLVGLPLQALEGKNIREIIGNSLQELKEKQAHEGDMVTLHQHHEQTTYIQWNVNEKRKDVILLVGTNITPLIKFSQEIQSSNKRLETLLANSGDLIFILDKSLVFQNYFNEGGEKLWVPESAFLHKKITEVGFPEKVLNEFLSGIEHAIRYNETAFVEYDLIIQKEQYWYDLKINAIKNEQNEVEEILCISRNKTTQKKVELLKERKNEKTRIHNSILLELSTTPIDEIESFEKIAGTIVEKISTGLDAAHVSLWNYNQGILTCVESFDKEKRKELKEEAVELAHYPAYFNAIQTGKPLLIPDISKDSITRELYQDYIKQNVLHSMMDIPVMVGGELQGVICCGYMSVIDTLNEEDESFVKMIAELVALFKEQLLRKKTETELIETQKMLEKSYTLAKLGVWEHDLITKKTYWSDTLKEIFEVDISHIPNDYQFPFYKDEMTSRRVRQFFANCIKTKKTYEIEFQIVTAKGNLRWVRVFGQAEYRNGKYVRIFGALQNIEDQVRAQKELQHSQQQFQYITDTIQDVFWLYDIEDQKIDYVSPSCKNILGYSPEEFYKNHELWQRYVIDEDKAMLAEAHLQIFTKGYFEVEYRIRVNGEIRWIFEKSFAIKNADGKPIKNSGISIDITSQKNAEMQMMLVKEIEETNKSKAAFLANMSHEMRTPLNGVIGLSDLLSTSNLDETQTKYVETIQSSANLLLEIINNILDYSKIDANKLELAKEPHVLKEVCEEVANMIQFIALQKKIKFELIYDDAIPAALIFDATRLKQVLINILGNAVKFTLQGSVTFYVRLLAVKEERVKLHFGIRDTGVGMKKEYLGKIFEAFSQEDITTTKRFGGTGLGLAISSKIIELMDSTLHVESEYEKGSHFSFLLDLDIADVSIIEQQAKPTCSYVNDLQASILLVEDNPVNTFLASAIIKSLLPNVFVIEARDGIDGAEKYNEYLPDLVLMDIQMPIMNGYEATNLIRKAEQKLQRRVPIIALTAGTNEEEKNKYVEMGMDDLLLKPVVKHMMQSILEKHLGVTFAPKPLIPTANNRHMNMANNDSLHLDRQQLAQSIKQNETFMKSFMPYVRESLEEGLAELKIHVANQDLKSIEIVSHRIKGTALSACMPNLAQLTKKLEFTDVFNAEDVENQLKNIEEEIKIVLDLL